MYQKLRSLLVAACLLPTALMPSASLAANPLEPASPNTATPTHIAQNTYPPELVRVYMDSCVGSASSANIPRELATSYCRCSIDRIQSTYTLEKFLELVQSATPGTLPPELETIASACVTSILN
jgi:hypothetical protein